MNVGMQTVAAARPGLGAQIFSMIRKDLLLEWRSRSRLVSLLLFGVVTLVLFSFAADADTARLRASAAGFLVIALLLSSTLALSESFRLERENSGIEGLLLLPADPIALFYGKALSSTLLLALLAPILAPIAIVLYSLNSSVGGLLAMLGIWALAAAGLAAPGTLYAAMTSRLQSRDVLLPILLFPLVVPVLLATVKALTLILNGDAMGQLRPWTLFLLSFDILHWSLGGILFSYVCEEA